jgi:AbrB family looped-hinge helix DNA binding protein
MTPRAHATTLARVRAKGQVTIPDDVRRRVRLSEGDYVQVSVQGDAIVLRPKKLVSASQAWFWTPEWQRGEREASADIEDGRVSTFESEEEFLESLD